MINSFPQKTKLFILFVLVLNWTFYAQTTVNSLEALLPYLNDDNVNVKLAPGEYTITGDDIDDGVFGNPIFLFEGSNSIYDFTGVTINFKTEIFKKFGKVDVKEIQILGNNNVLRNLTMVDDGSVTDNPSKTALGIAMDGAENRVEGFHMTVKGSWPYGYGDVFGKGGSNTVIFHYKHSAILVRGESNHVKDCTIIHRSYGHAIFMQAANNPIIEGCYVEGEMRTTDDILAEEGTGTRADDVDFMTTWGYRLPAGYMISTGEEGIRAYNGGETFIDGVSYSRGTSNPTVINCTIKNMRGGVTLAHATGNIYVRGCTAIGCEGAFGVGSGGKIIDCYADAAYGPVYKTAYDSDKNISAEITIIEPENGYYNGTNALAYLGGNNHDFVLKIQDSSVNDDLKIEMGGDHNDMRLLNGSNASQNNHSAENTELENYTGYAIILPSSSSGNDIITCGTFSDNGSGNTVTNSNDCAPVVCENHDAFLQIEAEDFCDMYGIETGSENSMVGWVNDGDWVKYEGVDFKDGVASITASVSSGNAGGNIEIREGSITGELLATLEVPNTGSWTAWETHSTNMNSSVSGDQDIYLVFTGGSGYLLDVDWFQFSNQTLSVDDNEISGDINSIYTYPNPALSSLTIVRAKNTTIGIYDMNGSLKLSQAISSDDQMLDVSLLSSGVYHAVVANESKKAVIKIVKK